MSAKSMLSWARRSLGWGEPNPCHRWYGARNGSYFARGSTPWCDMAITYWGYHSGNYDEVCPRGDRAYTVWHAQDGQHLGSWHSGTASNIRRYARPGTIYFCDWGGSNSVGHIDHVGVCERNLGDGRLAGIEGNTADACRRRVRGSEVIAGFWTPAYSDSGKPAPSDGGGSSGNVAGMLDRGDQGHDVEELQRDLNRLGWRLAVDGDFGEKTEHAVRVFQRHHALEVDGIVGPKTKAAIDKAIKDQKPAPKPHPRPQPRPRPKPRKPEVPVPNGTPYLQRGSDGARVRSLQQALNAKGWHLVVDGDFGPATEHAVRVFQRHHHLEADGIYGPATEKKLRASLR